MALCVNTNVCLRDSYTLLYCSSLSCPVCVMSVQGTAVQACACAVHIVHVRACYSELLCMCTLCDSHIRSTHARTCVCTYVRML